MRLTVTRLATSVALLLLVAPLATKADAQEYKAGKGYRIGVLMPGTPGSSAFHSRIEAFRRGLREVGYVEGQNVVLEFRWLGDDDSAGPRLALELARIHVDVIVTAGTPLALAAKQATTSIPIVVAAAGDFVGAGLVTNLARPGGNLTGTSDLTAELSGKRLELLREIIPRLSRVAVLWNAANPGAIRTLQETHTAARTLGFALLSLEIRVPADLGLAFERAGGGRVGALVVIQDPFTVVHRSRIIDLAARHRLAAIYGSDDVRPGRRPHVLWCRSTGAVSSCGDVRG